MKVKNKYRNTKTLIDGIKFDSRDEAAFYKYLQCQKADGEIKGFELQPKYELQSKFRDKDGKTYQSITYSPDYLIYHLDGSIELIDVKTVGTATQQGEMRRKMFIYKYPDLKLTWVSRDFRYATFGKEWVNYDDLKKILAKEKRELKKRREISK